MDNPIFIVGLPRTGSTLWHNIFAQNPTLFRMGEMLYLTPWRKDFNNFHKKYGKNLTSEEDVKKLVELMFSRRMVPGITASFWYHDIGKLDDPILKERIVKKIWGSDKSIGSIFKILLEEISAFKGHSRFCMKFPVYVNHIPELIEWYPQCKIVHIIRDPRAMAVSRTKDPEGTKMKLDSHPYLGWLIQKIMVYFVTFQYVWTSKLHLKYRHLKNYALYKYEDLLADPQRVIKNLCEFTEIDFVQEMLDPREGQASSITGKKHKGFNKRAAINWMNVISPLESKIVTWITRGSMKRFEYDPKNHLVFQDSK